MEPIPPPSSAQLVLDLSCRLAESHGAWDDVRALLSFAVERLEAAWGANVKVSVTAPEGGAILVTACDGYVTFSVEKGTPPADDADPPSGTARAERAGDGTVRLTYRFPRQEGVDGTVTVGPARPEVLDEEVVRFFPLIGAQIAGAADRYRLVRALRARERAERDVIERHERALDDLGHGLRNPAAALDTAVRVLADGEDRSRIKWATDVIARQSRKIAETLDGLSELSAIVSGRSPDPADAPQTIKGDKGDKEPHCRGLRVLVVDDNVDAATGLTHVLGTWGCDVRATYDARGAFDVVLDFRPDVVLLDIGLPDMDGFEVAEALRSGLRGSELYLIAVSGYAAGDRPGRADFDERLVKPIDFKRLSESLGEVSRRRRTVGPK